MTKQPIRIETVRERTMLDAASVQETTPFDYIVVGSGAGGGPLAARLAEGGAAVLVIEAGPDPLSNVAVDSAADTIRRAPLFHGQSTEDPEISWDFQVRHYADHARQGADTKCVPEREDPARPTVFKPRASALGGCTSHHAMITAYACDDAWHDIAELTGDDSWQPERMRRYFQRVEQCQYRRPFTFFDRFVRSVSSFLAAKPVDRLLGQHGSDGWLETNVTNPTTALGDPMLLKVLAGAFEGAKRAGLANKERLARAIGTGSIDGYLDPNDADHWQSEGPRLIPLGTRNGRRHGVRERLLDVRERHPERLVIATDTFATRVILSEDPAGQAPRALGVEIAHGKGLYRASPPHTPKAPAGTGRYFARREVILAGGAFNTPQLLCLSGIGPSVELEKHGIPCRANLPGVGRGLKDRYEVCVVGSLPEDFNTLKGVSFDPSDQTDEQLRLWREGKESLYGSNGGALAVLKKSRPDLQQPDIFMFAAPAMFRGYYPGWSKDVLRHPLQGSHPRERRSDVEHRNLLSWVILKARTRGQDGTVRLRSKDPFDTPLITHHFFGEGSAEGSEAREGARADLDAMVEGVRFARSLNDQIPGNQELWPASHADNREHEEGDDTGLRRWIMNEAWGHHPCGTCRIGKDDWRTNPAELDDSDAVLDSHCRVHGVRSLRVVDASVFPQIPGYFIVTPIYCVSEKIADDLLAEFAAYPMPLEQSESAAVRQRRRLALSSDPVVEHTSREKSRPAVATGALPENTVGLALSGGGIRAATFSLGVLQAFASRRRFREIDFMSTVSGGGYIGGFIGRLFQRKVLRGASAATDVEEILLNPSTPEIRWLRTQADYLDVATKVGNQRNIAVGLRNFLTLHLVIALTIFSLFGLLRGVGELLAGLGLTFWGGSPLWTLGVALFTLVALPLGVGFWVTPRPSQDETYAPGSPVAVIAATLALSYALAFPGWRRFALVGLLVIVASVVWAEVARLLATGYVHERNGNAGRTTDGEIMRNRLTGLLGNVIAMLATLVIVASVDTVARVAADASDRAWVAMKVFAPIPWGVLGVASSIMPSLARRTHPEGRRAFVTFAIEVTAYLIAGLLAVIPATAVHTLFDRSANEGWFAIVAAALLSLAISQSTTLVNFSSLHATYASRITRTFLGASNPKRTAARAVRAADDIEIAHPDDDVSFAVYRPDLTGGPLHVINTCLNETVDHRSFREVPDRHGLPLACGPLGISIGKRFHGTWVRGGGELSVKPLLASVDDYHPFNASLGKLSRVEPLTLGGWLAISGAALSPGSGRTTTTARALITGITNLRLGYWWDTDLGRNAPRRERWPNLWQTLRHLPEKLYRVQHLLFSELRGIFRGPNSRHWYLSDGGHFDNSGLYELLRRRLPFMIYVDASADPEFKFSDFANIVHFARVDFDANIEIMRPDEAQGSGWSPFGPRLDAELPAWIKDWIEPTSLGPIESIGVRGGKHAMLARVRYSPTHGAGTGWILILKASLTGTEPLDIADFASSSPSFPSEPTSDQSYDEVQWECYRLLGQHVGAAVLSGPAPDQIKSGVRREGEEAAERDAG